MVRDVLDISIEYQQKRVEVVVVVMMVVVSLLYQY